MFYASEESFAEAFSESLDYNSYQLPYAVLYYHKVLWSA